MRHRVTGPRPPKVGGVHKGNKGERGRHQQAGQGQEASAGETGSGGLEFGGTGSAPTCTHRVHLDWIPRDMRGLDCGHMYELVWMSGRTGSQGGTRSPPARLACSLARMTHDPALLLYAVDCSPYGNETRQVTCQFYSATMRRPGSLEQCRADRFTGHRAFRHGSCLPIACPMRFLNCKLPP